MTTGEPELIATLRTVTATRPTFAAAVLLGTDEKPTPLGVFPISQKKRHHVSNLYGAPMPFMQRLTDDGIALHASNVELGYASHGCIGMPEPFAEKVFGATKLGGDGQRVSSHMASRPTAMRYQAKGVNPVLLT